MAKQLDCRAKEAQARLHSFASHLFIHRLVIVTESLPRALPTRLCGNSRTRCRRPHPSLVRKTGLRGTTPLTSWAWEEGRGGGNISGSGVRLGGRARKGQEPAGWGSLSCLFQIWIAGATDGFNQNDMMRSISERSLWQVHGKVWAGRG